LFVVLCSYIYAAGRKESKQVLIFGLQSADIGWIGRPRMASGRGGVAVVEEESPCELWLSMEMETIDLCITD
jgi:hypothetical protein